jgi:hypothetical protein
VVQEQRERLSKYQQQKETIEKALAEIVGPGMSGDEV